MIAYNSKVPFASLREILIEHVITAFVEHRAVGIVHPPGRRLHMISGSVVIKIQRWTIGTHVPHGAAR